jgi:hypothetical protein
MQRYITWSKLSECSDETRQITMATANKVLICPGDVIAKQESSFADPEHSFRKYQVRAICAVAG